MRNRLSPGQNDSPWDHETLSKEQCHKYIYHEQLTHHDINTTRPGHVNQRVVSSWRSRFHELRSARSKRHKARPRSPRGSVALARATACCHRSWRKAPEATGCAASCLAPGYSRSPPGSSKQQWTNCENDGQSSLLATKWQTVCGNRKLTSSSSLLSLLIMLP